MLSDLLFCMPHSVLHVKKMLSVAMVSLPYRPSQGRQSKLVTADHSAPPHAEAPPHVGVSIPCRAPSHVGVPPHVGTHRM